MNEYAAEEMKTTIEAGRAALVAGAADLPAKQAELWREALRELDAAIKVIEPARQRLARVWARSDVNVGARASQSDTLIAEMNERVQGHLDAAERVMAEVAYQLQQTAVPARPADVSDGLVLDRKRELEGVLRRGYNGWKFTCEQVGDLMADAIAQHDELTAYVLTPDGPLAWMYKELLGDQRPMLRAAVYRAIRQAARESVPGDGLLRMLEAPRDASPTVSWPSLRCRVEELLGVVAGQAAYSFRQAAIAQPGWASKSEAQRAAESQEAAKMWNAGAVQAPELDNFKMRGGQQPQ
jgi:hypothetical protein